MKKILLSIAVIAGILFITCGNPPYEVFYEGTPEDSAAIMGILNDDFPGLMVTDEIFNGEYNVVDIDDIVWLDAELFFRADSPLIKQHVDLAGLELVTTPLEHYWDLWYAKDTSCTVFIRDTFDFLSLAHVDYQFVGHFDSAVVDTTVVPPDTVAWALGTVDTVDTAYYTDPREFTGQGRRVVFFDVIRQWVQDPEDPDDSVYAVREPIEWVLKRVLYGTYDFPAVADDVPSINTIILTRLSTGDMDTIFASNIDEDYHGHVMNRFRAIDSLLEYTDGETLRVNIALGGQVVAANCAFFATCGSDSTIDLGTTINRFPVTGDGITNLYFEVVETGVYYYVVPEQDDYLATMWLIPVRINTGGK